MPNKKKNTRAVIPIRFRRGNKVRQISTGKIYTVNLDFVDTADYQHITLLEEPCKGIDPVFHPAGQFELVTESVTQPARGRDPIDRIEIALTKLDSETWSISELAELAHKPAGQTQERILKISQRLDAISAILHLFGNGSNDPD